MKDDRAQAAFELITPAFHTRNYGAEGLHHLVMAVDYEHQILAHFFGTTDALRRDVKAFIVHANLDTCRHLEAATKQCGYVLPRATESPSPLVSNTKSRPTTTG